MSDLGERARSRRVLLRGHFSEPVTIEAAEVLDGDVYEVRARTHAGALTETTLTAAELERALAEAPPAAASVAATDLFLWVESHRIRLAYAHDPYFAVSLSGIRGLPHQIEAVYRHLLPQPRLRFVLADDPGAGKTIMAGLLLKELKLRGVVDRVLVVAPAPLTVQWQDELLDKFDERFELVSAHQVRGQLAGNPWQHHQQVVTSLDFAKRPEIAPDLLRADWDLVVVDEAHKCSAVTEGDTVRRTRRYELVERLSLRAERLLMLTATPHSGDRDRFRLFLALLDPDQFATPNLVRRQIGEPGNPWFLRRQKEDLVDEQGQSLFVRRRVLTQPFTLSPAEMGLYQQVTTYINRFLGPAPGRRGNAVALARTVLQRRLASSLGAIRSSLERRARKLATRAEELAKLRPDEQRKRLAALGVLDAADEETGTEDADEIAEETAATEVAVHAELASLRIEVAELRRLQELAERTIAAGEERKLAALRDCLVRAELAELRDGRGKLLIFTEHRDTLEHLRGHLARWGYSVCAIHGGHPATERKRIQHEFRTRHQVCVATEAAGEGINLQFCHLMINYDLPWNPVRLEQRMGRIHRIGQRADVAVLNFCATNTIEGELLGRLHAKLEEMRAALHGRVYDVIGELLDHNQLDFERLVRETLANPGRLDESVARIAALDPGRLRAYERDVGVAQATRHVNLDWVRQRDWDSQERRLMPEYVEAFATTAARRAGLRLERRRGDGLYRVEHVPVTFRSDELPSVRRLGRPETSYRKLTFHKEHRERPEHEDAVLLSPGHPLFGALADVLHRELGAAGVPGAVAGFVDPAATEPYRLHFVTCEVIGESQRGEPETVRAELVAVVEEAGGDLSLAPADVLHDLTPAPRTAEPPPATAVTAVTNWVRAEVQRHATDDERQRRVEMAALRRRYLSEAMHVQIQALEQRWARYDDLVFRGDDSYRLPRDETLRRIDDTNRRRATKLAAFERLGVVRPGPVSYLGTAAVTPPPAPDDPAVRVLRPDPAVEQAAMDAAMAFERTAGREPEDVSQRRDGSGFDIRSLTRDPSTGQVTEVRRIEVKGRSTPTGDVGLYRTEWYAAQRFRDGYWLYVLYAAGTPTQRLVTIQDPWARLQDVHEITQVTGYRVLAASIESAAR